MNDRSFTKLFSSIVTSSVWCEDSDTRVVWITILALCNEFGIVTATAPGLARIANVPIEKTRQALDKFQQPDNDSRSIEFDGRRIQPVDGGWKILNYGKYRSMMSEADRREYKAAWDREKRPNRPSFKDRTPDSTPDKPRQPRQLGRQAEAEGEAEAEAEGENKEERECELSPPSDEEASRFEDQLMEEWNKSELTKINRMNPTRIRVLKARMKDEFFRENWQKAIQIASKSSFLAGKNDRGWKATIDWFLRPNTIDQIVEGKYADRGPSSNDDHTHIPD